MSRRYQGGSLVGFIVVGVLLAVVLVGGLYGLNRYNAQKTSEAASSNNEKKTEKPTNVAKNEDTNADKKTSEQPATTEPEKQSDASADQTPTTPAQSGTNDATDLPTTGPSDIAWTIVAIAALSFAATHYVRSRSRA